VEVVVGEREVEIAHINGGLGRHEAAAAAARGMGGGRVVVVFDDAADAPRGLGRGHGHGEAIRNSTTTSAAVNRGAGSVTCNSQKWTTVPVIDEECTESRKRASRDLKCR